MENEKERSDEIYPPRRILYLHFRNLNKTKREGIYDTVRDVIYARYADSPGVVSILRARTRGGDKARIAVAERKFRAGLIYTSCCRLSLERSSLLMPQCLSPRVAQDKMVGPRKETRNQRWASDRRIGKVAG